MFVVNRVIPVFALVDRQLQSQRRCDIDDQFADALAVFGGDRERRTKANRERIVIAVIAFFAFGFVSYQYDWLARCPHQPRKSRIGWRDACARINHEQDEIGVFDGFFRLLAHPVGDGTRCRVFKPGGIDHGDRQATKIGDALAAVARQTWNVGHQCGAGVGQPVIERRFADVGPANDGDQWKFRHRKNGAHKQRGPQLGPLSKGVV